ncbi:serine protease snake-like isoform X2 [Linepithema humile]|uniref:serine protease snake-like isoform X2 n=1 Tax=Linepithema humile TaxID=83485 RepID=UPI0006233F6C|nr:PREDICTED: serine protease snake-like isoform X2 [Linepithema humile]
MEKNKCKEYAALVYESEDSPILRINAGSNKVSRCTIVETPLIVGGVPVKPVEFPHMTVIGYGKEGDISWQCGGSIISENFILTAAHCMESPDKGPAAKVRVGLIDLSTPDDVMQERDIVERIKHPDYKSSIRYHDIALLRLDRSLELNSRVRPACLEVNSQIPGKSAIASGFGKTSYESTIGSNELMKVQLNYISEDDCKKSYADDIGIKGIMPQGLIPNLLCAGIMEGGKDTCQGDSGGPLQRILTEPYCMYSIVGVTSFGKFCAFKSMPAIYTRVSSYLDWIENIVWS